MKLCDNCKVVAASAKLLIGMGAVENVQGEMIEFDIFELCGPCGEVVLNKMCDAMPGAADEPMPRKAAHGFPGAMGMPKGTQ